MSPKCKGCQTLMLPNCKCCKSLNVAKTHMPFLSNSVPFCLFMSIALHLCVLRDILKNMTNFIFINIQTLLTEYWNIQKCFAVQNLQEVSLSSAY